MEKDLNKIKMHSGKTAAEWLKTQPEEWRSIETEAIYECLNRGITLDTFSIQRMARALNSGDMRDSGS
jgi:hypothetical protein